MMTTRLPTMYRAADDKLVYAKGIVEGVANGVGLHHVAHQAQRQNDGYCEEACQELPKAALKCLPDVVDRAADDLAGLRAGLELLGQHSLAVNRCHAKERGQPHPEYGARTAGNQRGCAAGDVARTYLGRNGRGQRLEGAHAVLVSLLAK